MTSPHHRGQSVAAACLFEVFDRLARDGIGSVLTKIAEDNGGAGCRAFLAGCLAR